MRGRLGAVLVTSASAKVPLVRAVREAALRLDPEARVIAGDLDPEAPARYVADAFWTMPRLDDLGLEDLAAACQARDIRTILPTRDGELAYWAKAKPYLAQHDIGVIVSSPEAVDLCLDKLAFGQWGKDRGLPVIATSDTPEPFGNEVLVVKERFGAGSRSLGLGLTREEALRHAEGLSQPLFQPQIQGPEISIDAWCRADGAVHGLVLRHRHRVVRGESQITLTFRNERLEAEATKVLNALNLSGPVVMQAIVMDDGLQVIEVNARFGGASTASIPVGLDLIYWALLERLEPERPLPAFERQPFDIRQVRVAEDIVIRDPDL